MGEREPTRCPNAILESWGKVTSSAGVGVLDRGSYVKRRATGPRTSSPIGACEGELPARPVLDRAGGMRNRPERLIHFEFGIVSGRSARCASAKASRPSIRVGGAMLDPSTASRSGQRSSLEDSLRGAKLNPIDRPAWETVRRARLDPLRSVPGSEAEPPSFSGVETLESQTVKPLSGTVLPVGKGFGAFPLKPVATLCQDFAPLEQHFAKVGYCHRPRVKTARTRRSCSILTRVLRALRSAFFFHLGSRKARLSSVAHHV